eukprot:XP_001705348.1 Hypothetical protein GL50803_31022 [Giardia lamblia ATCC 50803]
MFIATRAPKQQWTGYGISIVALSAWFLLPSTTAVVIDIPSSTLGSFHDAPSMSPMALSRLAKLRARILAHTSGGITASVMGILRRSTCNL